MAEQLTDFELLTDLIAACRCEVSVIVNAHRNDYESVAQHLSHDDNDDTDADVRAEMIRRDTIVEVQAYPTTPVGFYAAKHWDVASALRTVLNAVKAEASDG